MSAKQIVIIKLLAAADVIAIVGNRIWGTNAPQAAALPYVIVTKPGSQNRQLLESDAGFPRTRIRLECVAASGAEAAKLQRAAFNALKNVTRETVTDGQTPAAFSAIATITPSDFEVDGFSDARNAAVEITDFYVDWKLN
jgi:hypothetical protein